MKSILNSKGFSLIEVTVAMGLMGGFVWGFMQLSDKIIESEKKMMDLMEMNELVARVRYVLNDTVACNKTFKIEKMENGFLLPSSLTKILDRRDKVIIEAAQRQGRLTINNIRVELEEINGEHLEDEPRFANLFFELSGSSKYNKNKVFKIAVPVLLEANLDKSFKFLYCDSMASGVAQEMTNEIMKRLCDSFQVPYNVDNGQCEFDKMSLGGNMLQGDLFKQIQKLMQEQLKK